jgi:putative SOS response-associated peptidase YedK
MSGPQSERLMIGAFSTYLIGAGSFPAWVEEDEGMCGRAKLETDVSEIKIAFRIPPEYPTPNCAPSWNVAPTDNLPIVRYDAKAGSRTLDLMRWGLVPYWAKDIKIGFSTINAMAETVDTKPVFREAFQRRRCS